VNSLPIEWSQNFHPKDRAQPVDRSAPTSAVSANQNRSAEQDPEERKLKLEIEVEVQNGNSFLDVSFRICLHDGKEKTAEMDWKRRGYGRDVGGKRSSGEAVGNSELSRGLRDRLSTSV
jgi:hypothetical protein